MIGGENLIPENSWKPLKALENSGERRLEARSSLLRQKHFGGRARETSTSKLQASGTFQIGSPGSDLKHVSLLDRDGWK
jgi:hypothetical protein